VSTVEGRNLPLFSTQWHPEKVAYEFDDVHVPHTRTAIQAGLFTAQLLVDVARLNPTQASPFLWPRPWHTLCTEPPAMPCRVRIACCAPRPCCAQVPYEEQVRLVINNYERRFVAAHPKEFSRQLPDTMCARPPPAAPCALDGGGPTRPAPGLAGGRGQRRALLLAPHGRCPFFPEARSLMPQVVCPRPGRARQRRRPRVAAGRREASGRRGLMGAASSSQGPRLVYTGHAWQGGLARTGAAVPNMQRNKKTPGHFSCWHVFVCCL
jgi:hypothetical protein